MRFERKAEGSPAAVALFAGGFHPPTIAHAAIAKAALSVADEVVFVLPRAYPHKTWDGAPIERRLAWLDALARTDARYSIAVSDGGLFVDIARECRAAYPGARVLVICGRDAAERIAGWDYRDREPFPEQLREFELLVAARRGEYQPPPELAARVHALAMPASFDDVSSTEVRSRMAAGAAWRHLVPAGVAELMESDRR